MTTAAQQTAQRRRLIYVSERLKVVIEEMAALKAEREVLLRSVAAMSSTGVDPA